MKRIIIILLMMGVSSVYAQTTITTESSKICFWNDSTKAYDRDCEYHEEHFAKLEFNKEETSFKHTTQEMSSIYYVDKFERNKTDEVDLFIYDVTSDVGNKYMVLVDVKNLIVRFAYIANGYIHFVTTSNIKAIFKTEE
jgi:hypothetical protein